VCPNRRWSLKIGVDSFITGGLTMPWVPKCLRPRIEAIQVVRPSWSARAGKVNAYWPRSDDLPCTRLLGRGI